jgi:hypothetical protein
MKSLKFHESLASSILTVVNNRIQMKLDEQYFTPWTGSEALGWQHSHAPEHQDEWHGTVWQLFPLKHSLII